MSLYDRDFHAWAHEQAALARDRSSNALDWDNIAEELESLGNQQRSELKSRYTVLLLHLLKWAFKPERRSRSWSVTIRNQRDEIGDHLKSNPSLKASDDEVFALAYRLARREASVETSLEEHVFPQESPFTPDQARDDTFWPEPL